MLKMENSKFEDTLFKVFLKSMNLSYTFERRIILNAIKEITKDHSHFTVETLYNHLAANEDRVSKGTLYKTFKLLEQCNLIRKTDITTNCNTYEKVEQKNIGHLVCSECEKTIEISGKLISNIIKQICTKRRFKIKSQTLKINGNCFDCLNKKNISIKNYTIDKNN